MKIIFEILKGLSTIMERIKHTFQNLADMGEMLALMEKSSFIQLTSFCQSPLQQCTHLSNGGNLLYDLLWTHEVLYIIFENKVFFIVLTHFPLYTTIVFL